MNFVTTISTKVEKLKRVIKFLRYGKSNTQTSSQIAPHGIDSNPVQDMVALYARTEEKGKTVIIGYINKNVLAEVGETRIYSTDSDGELQTYIWLKNDGTMHIGGDADFMVRYNKLAEVIDEIKNDIGTLKQVFTNWVPVANDGGAALKTGSGAWAGTAFTKNIEDAKIEEIKKL
jgi:hypothetical protein